MRMNGERSFGNEAEWFSTGGNCAQRTGRGQGSDEALSSFTDQTYSPLPAPSSLSHRVVTLAFLSEPRFTDLISEQLAAALWTETGELTVLVRFERETGGDCRKADLSLNGEFHMPPQIHRTAAGFHILILGVGPEPPSPAGIASLVSQLRLHFHHVLLAAPVDEDSAPWPAECVLRSSLTYLLTSAKIGESQFVHPLLRRVRSRSGPQPPRVKLIGCAGREEESQDFDQLTQTVALPVHLFIHDCPGLAGASASASETALSGLFRADVRRLAREICGRWVGLALSSGAAKGFAHVGVIQVLEENGIEVDIVAGSSMGAYVGSLWAYGRDGAELERIAREMEARWSLLSLVDPAFPPRQGFLRGFAVKKRLMRTIGHVRFAELARPLRVVAGNLATLERVVFSAGEVAPAVHASCAVPGVCVPVTIDGETYIDGGIVDPLPVDVLREMGVARVIAVDVIPTLERIRAGLGTAREPKRSSPSGVRQLFRQLLPVNQQLNYFARGNILEILMRSLYGAQIRVAQASSRLADLVLRPDIGDDRWLDYRNPRKFIALGRAAAERRLEEIKALVAGKELNHEQQPASDTLAATA